MKQLLLILLDGIVIGMIIGFIVQLMDDFWGNLKG